MRRTVSLQHQRQRRAAHRHGDAQLAQAALQPREVALGVGQLAAEHRPDLVDAVGELVAAVLDVDDGLAVRDEAAVDIGDRGSSGVLFLAARARRPKPSDFSLRCRAERSMPMKAAVREMLPPKRRIWALRYSRSNTSRASRSGRAMIRSAPRLAGLVGDHGLGRQHVGGDRLGRRRRTARISIRSTLLRSWRTLPGQALHLQGGDARRRPAGGAAGRWPR